MVYCWESGHHLTRTEIFSSTFFHLGELFLRNSWIDEERADATRIRIIVVYHHRFAAAYGFNGVTDIQETWRSDVLLFKIALQFGITNGRFAVWSEPVCNISDD